MVEHPLWERAAVGSNPIVPIHHTSEPMIEVTLAEFEKNFDSYMDKIETEKISYLVRHPDGKGVVAMPADDEYRHLWDHDDGA